MTDPLTLVLMDGDFMFPVILGCALLGVLVGALLDSIIHLFFKPKK